jgi:hypothetical protein
MGKALKTVRGWINHPAISFASNVQFVIGTAVLIAGALGGVLAVLTSFPPGWLAVTVVGAFLMTIGALRTFVPAVRQPRRDVPTAQPQIDPYAEQSRQRAEKERAEELRRVVGRFLTELENARGGMQRAVDSGYWWLDSEIASTYRWSTSADDIAAAGLREVHRTLRIAYRHIAEVRSTWETIGQAYADQYDYDPPLGSAPALDDLSRLLLADAIAAIETAERALEDAELP